MKLRVLALASVLLISSCASSPSTDNTAGTIESACEAVRAGFLWLHDDSKSDSEQLSEANKWFDEAIPVFRDLSGSNPKYVEYLEILGRIKTKYTYSFSDDYEARPLQSFCSVPVP